MQTNDSNMQSIFQTLVSLPRRLGYEGGVESEYLRSRDIINVWQTNPSKKRKEFQIAIQPQEMSLWEVKEILISSLDSISVPENFHSSTQFVNRVRFPKIS